MEEEGGRGGLRSEQRDTNELAGKYGGERVKEGKEGYASVALVLYRQMASLPRRVKEDAAGPQRLDLTTMTEARRSPP